MNSNSMFGGKISGAQTVSLLLLCSMFSLMTMPPDENAGFKVQLAAAAVSAASARRARPTAAVPATRMAWPAA